MLKIFEICDNIVLILLLIINSFPLFFIIRTNVETYCLMIAEEDGEVDMDFPALDSKEAMSKFGFNTLALVEKDAPQDEKDGVGKGNIIVTMYVVSLLLDLGEGEGGMGFGGTCHHVCSLFVLTCYGRGG